MKNMIITMFGTGFCSDATTIAPKSQPHIYAKKQDPGGYLIKNNAKTK